MTERQVTAIVEMAHAKGCRNFDRYDGALFLMCQEILEREPKNAKAIAVSKELNHFIVTGEKPTSFDEFELPIPYTEERLAKMARGEYR